MRKLNEIVIHCLATEQGKEFSVKQITKWHVKGRGFRNIGYHFVIHIDGKIERGRPLAQMGAYAKGHNRNSIGVVYVGGLINGKPADTRTVPQIHALRGLVEALKSAFNIVKVVGHRDLSVDLNGDGVISKQERMKECPCFDVATEI